MDKQRLDSSTEGRIGLDSLAWPPHVFHYLTQSRLTAVTWKCHAAEAKQENRKRGGLGQKEKGEVKQTAERNRGDLTGQMKK